MERKLVDIIMNVHAIDSTGLYKHSISCILVGSNNLLRPTLYEVFICDFSLGLPVNPGNWPISSIIFSLYHAMD